MKSLNVKYLHGLDHLRAFAAFTVFFWHAVHYEVLTAAHTPKSYVMSFLEEGHSGISLFIVITGFIFTFIIGEKEISYPKFLYNRFIRIVPLLFIITLFGLVLNDKVGDDPLALLAFFNLLGGGTVFGTWSLVIEFQFYLLFPIFYLYFRNKISGAWLKYLPYILMILLGYAFRLMYFVKHGNFQEIAYWTMFGRIDQFMLGAISALLINDLNHKLGTSVVKQVIGWSAFLIGTVSIVVFYKYFNDLGGFYHQPEYPSPSVIWLYLPTFEGLCYSLMLIGWVLITSSWNNFITRSLAYLGSISYSTYLLHLPAIALCQYYIKVFGIEFGDAPFFNRALLSILIMYPFIIMLSIISYEVLEKPFLSKRVVYKVS